MIVLVAAALLAQAMPIGRMPATLPRVPPGAAVIRNSGSTNAAGYTIVLAPDGNASIVQNDGVAAKVVGAPQTHWLFLKLQQAAPLDAVATAHCMKSASFGTSTTITWNDRTSGDLSCAEDALGRELERTVAVIARALDIRTFPRIRRVRTM